MSLIFKVALFTCLVVAVLPGSQSANTRTLFLVGGGLDDDNDEIYSKFVELSGGSGEAKIGIVTGASADPLDSADFYLQQFLTYGAKSTYFIPVYIGNEGAAIDESVVEQVRREPLVQIKKLCVKSEVNWVILNNRFRA